MRFFRARRQPETDSLATWHRRPVQRNGKPRWATFAALPWIEAIISAIVGIILVALNRQELAELTWIIGISLSFSRYAFSKKLEEEMIPVHRLASVVDLQRDVSLDQFQHLIRVYLEITEPEFRQVKETVIEDTIARLQQLATNKTSDELATGDYYSWLLPFIEGTKKGSHIWAVSMMLDVEWDNSAPEESFLELNLDAAKRGVYVERIFVLPRAVIPNLEENPGIMAHLDSSGEFLIPRAVDRELLESKDPDLLNQLGDGLIAFDNRIALIDKNTATGIRGYVTMNPREILRLSRMFDSLRVHARPLKAVIDTAKGKQAQLPPTTPPTT